MKAKIVLLLLAVPLLLAVASAQASLPSSGAVPLALEEELDFEAEEEGEYEEDECTEAEEELAEGELSEGEVDEICEAGEAKGKGAKAGGVLPEECLLRTFHPQAAANDSGAALKLTIGYTTYRPVEATIEVRKGNVRIGAFHRHLGRSGVLRFVERPRGKQVAKRLSIRFRIPGSAPSCERSQTKTAVVR